MKPYLIITILIAGILPLPAQSCWPNFRGDAQFSGVSTSQLPESPELLWNFKTEDAIKASPVVCDNKIVIGSVDGNVYGITMDGKMAWKINSGNGIEASALINNGKAFIGNLDGKVMAIELATGKTLWSYQTDGQILGAPNFWKKGNGGVVLVGSYDYFLHGIDANTGKGLWKYEADNFLNGAPAIYEDVAIFGGCDGLLHQVNVANGSLKDKQPVATYVAGSVAVDNWVTFVGDYDGKFTCLDLNTGKESWSYINNDAQLPFIASPSLSDDAVYIGNRDKYVYAFNRIDGSLLWKKNVRGMVDASPVLIGDILLVGTTRGDLLLLDAKTGDTRWSYEIGSSILGTPAVIDNHIIVGAEDGRVYCFGNSE